MRSRFLEPCQGQERWRKWAPQRLTVLTERIGAVSQSEPKEQEDADALGRKKLSGKASCRLRIPISGRSTAGAGKQHVELTAPVLRL